MKDFNRQKVVLFLAAGVIGFLLHTLHVPIPYMLGGIVVTFVSKTFIDPQTRWSAAWRNFMLSIGGVEIGRDCSFETLVNLSNQVFGVLSATGSIVIVSFLASLLTFRFCNVNLISCFMGCAPGGMSLMTLMAEEDSRADMNFVVVAQTLRFTFVVACAPFLAMAPGGIAEMCLAGLSMGADVPQILTYQLFRLLFLNFTLPFAINLYFKRTDESPPTTN